MANELHTDCGCPHGQFCDAARRTTVDDLSDDDLALLSCDEECECIFCRAGAVIRRHRAMVQRLEAWADELYAGPVIGMGEWFADELRDRMKGG